MADFVKFQASFEKSATTEIRKDYATMRAGLLEKVGQMMVLSMKRRLIAHTKSGETLGSIMWATSKKKSPINTSKYKDEIRPPNSDRSVLVGSSSGSPYFAKGKSRYQGGRSSRIAAIEYGTIYTRKSSDIGQGIGFIRLTVTDNQLKQAIKSMSEKYMKQVIDKQSK